MAAQAAKATEGEEEKKGGKAKLVIFALIGVLVLGAGGAGAAWFFGLLGGGKDAGGAEPGALAGEHAPAEEHGGESGHEEKAGIAHGAGQKAEAPRPAEGVHFVDLPDVLVNLRSEGPRMRYLKLRVALEVRDAATAEAVRSLMPRVMDSLQLYLRSLSVDDVRGAIGMERLKEEMLARINRAIRPHRVDDVLFKEMLVQ